MGFVNVINSVALTESRVFGLSRDSLRVSGFSWFLELGVVGKTAHNT